MGSIRTSTKSVPIVLHKLTPELLRCILFHKEACKEVWQEDCLQKKELLWYDSFSGSACNIWTEPEEPYRKD